MNTGLLVGAIANAVLGLSLLVDKILLKDRLPGNVLAYVFWIGVFNLFGLILLPFGVAAVSLKVVLLAAAAGIAFLVAIFAYYRALEAGDASPTIAAVGGLSPLATLLLSNALLASPLNIAETIGFGFLVFGGFLMLLAEGRAAKTILPWALLAAGLLGLTNVLEKMLFTETTFATGFVLAKLATLAGALLLLAVPAARRAIAARSAAAPVRYRLGYAANRFMAGVANMGIFYAVSRAHPALVESLSGVRYAVIFVAAFIITNVRPQWLSETFRGAALAMKFGGTLAIAVGLVGIGAQSYLAGLPVPDAREVSWGLTFSQKMARDLGVDWRAAYRDILYDLRPRGIRLIAYWDEVEPARGAHRFDDLDWQMDEARAAGIPVVLVVGQKVPRWPECHYPPWLNSKDKALREEAFLEHLDAIVAHYASHPALAVWQVENEPFLPFGVCPLADGAFFDKEIAEVRRLDPSHPIMTTDSGEFGVWYPAASRGDLFGTTLYRKVYNKVFGEITYPITPEFFVAKKKVVQFFTGKPDSDFSVIELGLEPWGRMQIAETPLEEQMRLFSFDDFKDTIAFARRARFRDYYLWGTEWWYWLKTKENDPRYWDYAKTTIASGVPLSQ